MHTIQILWFLLWPVSIFIAYHAVIIALRRYERKFDTKNDDLSTP